VTRSRNEVAYEPRPHMAKTSQSDIKAVLDFTS